MRSRPHTLPGRTPHFPLSLAGGRVFGAGLLLLALWVQVLAPAVALRWDLAATGPLLGQAICGSALDSAGTGATAEQSPPAMPGCSHCGLCAAGVVTPILPTLPGIARALSWQVVSWSIPPTVRLSLPPDRQPHARGPPTLA